MKNIHIISGLPRSGSTLLAAILRQNPKFHAAMTSPLLNVLGAAHQTMGAHNEGSMQITKEQRVNILKGVVHNYYAPVTEDKEIIFDTNRIWTTRMPLINELFPEAKVICCVRDVAWIMDSFERAIQRDPTRMSKMFSPEENQNVYTRTETLAAGQRQVGAPWNALREAYYGPHSDKLMLIEMGALTYNPKAIIDKLYEFIGEEPFEHDFDNVSYEAHDFDDALGIPGLHKVEGKVEFRPRQTILPPDVFKKYAAHTFWRDNLKTKAQVYYIKEDSEEN